MLTVFDESITTTESNCIDDWTKEAAFGITTIVLCWITTSVLV